MKSPLPFNPGIPTTNVPQIPATKCTEIAPTTSSILSLSKNWIGSQIINCGGLEIVCRKKIAEVLKEEVFPNLKIKIVKPPEKFYKDRPPSITMVSTELSSILGRPQRSLREAIRMEFV